MQCCCLPNDAALLLWTHVSVLEHSSSQTHRLASCRSCLVPRPIAGTVPSTVEAAGGYGIKHGRVGVKVYLVRVGGSGRGRGSRARPATGAHSTPKPPPTCMLSVTWPWESYSVSQQYRSGSARLS